MCPQPSIDLNKQQLTDFIQDLKTLFRSLKQDNIGIPKELDMLLQGKNENLAQILEDVLKQQFKYYNAYPGQMIKIISLTGHALNVPLYVVRDSEGNFQLLLKDGNESKDLYYKIYPYNQTDKKINETWEPHLALLVRMQYLSTHVPPHLKEHRGLEKNELEVAVYENQSEIAQLQPNEPKIITTKNGFNLHVRKTVTGELQVLLETTDTEDPSSPIKYLRVDCPENVVYKDYKGVLLDTQARKFMSDIEHNAKNFKVNDFELKWFVKQADLNNIYDYILQNPEILAKLATGQSIRVAKGTPLPGGKKLPRTFNIIRSASGEYMLMLGTGLKFAGHTRQMPMKSPALLIYEAEEVVKVKPCWRIDTSVPEEWANKVTKKETQLIDSVREATFSQYAVSDQTSGSHNVTLYGQIYTSKDNTRINQFSRRAVTDLESVEFMKKLSNNEVLTDKEVAILKKLKDQKVPDILLSEEDIDRFIETLLLSVRDLHKIGMVHQDLKLPNIFVIKNKEGHYIPALADYGIAFREGVPHATQALATYFYESPEIRMANTAENSSDHNYYFPNIPNYPDSYARGYLRQAQDFPNDPDFNLPDPKNDMWALGIIIFRLRYGHRPEFKKEDIALIEKDPLLKGLLAPNREQRFDIERAIEKFEDHKKNVALKKELERKGFHNIGQMYEDKKKGKILTSTKIDKAVVDRLHKPLLFFMNNPCKTTYDALSQQVNEELNTYNQKSPKRSCMQESVKELGTLLGSPPLSPSPNPPRAKKS